MLPLYMVHTLCFQLAGPHSYQHPLRALAGRLDLLRRWWEGDTHTVGEEDRPVGVRHSFMHQGAVAVPLHMRLISLMRVAPRGAADLAAWQCPLGEAVEELAQPLRFLGRHKVNEGVAQSSVRPEVDRQVQEVVLTREARPIDQVQQHGSCIVVGQVPQHDRGAAGRRLVRRSLATCCSKVLQLRSGAVADDRLTDGGLRHRAANCHLRDKWRRARWRAGCCRCCASILLGG
mmetsp:Transcript_100101/g.250928  ORF Transcript_100101/g.250928 Transcript_100101/m.250928 type:complete len:232 (+) Transcript_100101:207-902(+)